MKSFLKKNITKPLIFLESHETDSLGIFLKSFLKRFIKAFVKSIGKLLEVLFFN